MCWTWTSFGGDVYKRQQETQNGQQPTKEAGTTAQAPQQPDKSKSYIDPDKVDWEALKHFGLSQEQLEKAKALEPVSYTHLDVYKRQPYAT